MCTSMYAWAAFALPLDSFFWAGAGIGGTFLPIRSYSGNPIEAAHLTRRRETMNSKTRKSG